MSPTQRLFGSVSHASLGVVLLAMLALALALLASSAAAPDRLLAEADAGVTQCSDGIDNDEDGFTDFPEDTGCSSESDNTEAGSLPPPQCSNGTDDDGDGKTDYPNDPGCDASEDNSEAPNPQCSDGIDNDSDGQTDYQGNDWGCDGPADNSEAPNPQCSDGIDNDGDGKTDYIVAGVLQDPGCNGYRDDSETNPQCSDGIDNDGDGRTDHPNDPGCFSERDSSEAPDPPDDDGDGVPDNEDDCPTVAGSTFYGCPVVPRTLTISYSNPATAFRGVLSSPKPACERNELVSVFKKVTGADRKIGDDLTNERGRYVVPAPRRPGRYYAKAPESFDPPLVGYCQAARSSTITLR